jgi:hypothetical protein
MGMSDLPFFAWVVLRVGGVLILFNRMQARSREEHDACSYATCTLY